MVLSLKADVANVGRMEARGRGASTSRWGRVHADFSSSVLQGSSRRL